MLSLIAVAAASFVYIALKAIQQRQVMAAEYIRMPIVSMSMAFCEVFIMSNVAITAVTNGLMDSVYLALALGFGGGMGSMLGTWLHKRY